MFYFVETIFDILKIMLVLIVTAGTVFAAGDIEKYHNQVKDLEKQIEVSQDQLDTLKKQETAVLAVLEQNDMILDALKKQISEYRSEISKLNEEMLIAKNHSRELQIKVHAMRQYANKRLVAIYKTNQSGTLSMMASADSVSEFLFRKKALENIFAHDNKVLGDLNQVQAELDNLLEEIESRKQKKLELEKELNNEIAAVSLERKKRNQILNQIRNKKSLENALVEAYRQAALNLDNIISSLSNEKNEQRIETFSSDEPFDSSKGLLIMPVNGTITARFGSYKDKTLNVERFSNGIFLRTDRGEPVHAVKEGQILFAGWFKGYGKMIIIDHGNHYHTVYAHAEEIFKNKGDPVESGEVIATVGDSGSVSEPELYFEVRHHGKPVDPLEWIRKG